MCPEEHPILTYKEIYFSLQHWGYSDIVANPVARAAALAGVREHRKAVIDEVADNLRGGDSSHAAYFYAGLRRSLVPVRAYPASLRVVVRILKFHDPDTVRRVVNAPCDEVRGAMLTHLLELGPAAAKGFGHFMYSAPLPLALKP